MAGTWAWSTLMAAALLLPVDLAARWFVPTYTATAADIRDGIWILKLALAALGVAALVMRRYTLPRRLNRVTSRERVEAAPVVLGVIIVVAAALRLWRLDTELWLDEIALLTRYVPLDFSQLISTFDSQNHQPLYSMLARLSYLVAGGADWSIRIPAVLFGVASVIAVFAFGRRVTSRAEATLASLILAVSYHHVWFSQNARGYTAMLFFAIVGSLCFINLCENRGRAWRLAWAYALVMALATYTHMTAALIAIGHAISLALTTRWSNADARARASRAASALVLSGILTVVLYAPMLPQVWRNITTPTMEGVEVEWTGARWLVTEGLRVLSEGVPGGLAAVVIALVVLGVGVVSYWRRSRQATLIMFLPVIVTLVAVIATRHNLWPRFFFFAAGFLVLAALRGGFVLVHSLLRRQADQVAIAGASLVALLSLLTVPRAWAPKQQFEAAREFVEGERQPGDEVVAVDIASAVYLLRGTAPSWRRLTSLDLLRDTERIAGRTWIVYTLPARIRALTPDVYQYLQPPRYEVVRVFPAGVGGAEIYILRHDPSASHD